MSLDIIVYIFSGGVGGGIVSFLLKSWFETRLKNSIKHEYDKRLLELKASIDKESSLLSMLQANYSHKNNLSHERTLNAIESLWAGILVIRELKPSILTVVDVWLRKSSVLILAPITINQCSRYKGGPTLLHFFPKS
ncbi:hypothetical protein [Vibrio harveyi]|uniref:hypothetical protein n=1 Tax=Vibrio harveyi TaxID=669 RepID=UPI00217CC43F|nr:hypothetical protein [Vibrio harveyi]